MHSNFTISGQIVDIHQREIYGAIVTVEDGYIKKITKSEDVDTQFIMPGFIDAHVHIESSMLVPTEFARLAVVHGTVATISDPHEIGNVMGINGVEYMIENGRQVDFKFYFGAPSCVPATSFETAGAQINASEIKALLNRDEIKYLAEMMNWPGVLNRDPEVMEKLEIAKACGKVIDGHAPGLKGDLAKQYIAAGISTDHECFTAEEAMDKLSAGMKIIIREGSAAKNFEALIALLHDYPEEIMFCSDDKHPDNLVEGHINELVKRALGKGIDLFKILKAACINPIEHYGLNVGQINIGDPADFIVVDTLHDFNILKTFINGKLVAENGLTKINSCQNKIINNFNISTINATDLEIKAESEEVFAIEVLDGQLITNKVKAKVTVKDGLAMPNIEEDVLKMVVVNRYAQAKVAVGFIKNFGLKSGALASSVAHDSHNIIAVGIDDKSIAEAINLIIKEKGGVAAVGLNNPSIVALPVAGLMSANDGYQVADAYSKIDAYSKSLGSTLKSPFMSLSFMALLVIPSCKLSDKGLFDGDKFEFIKLFNS